MHASFSLSTPLSKLVNFLCLKKSTTLWSMSTITFRPAGIRASALPDQTRGKPTSSRTNWWTPLFGWSSEPDYMDSENKAKIDPKASKSTRFVPGSFTEEKAKQLRKMTMETETFHDVMYHSAIASRLASDFKKSSSITS